MPTLLRLLNHYRPREGWPALLLTLTAVLCPTAALLEARKDAGVGWLLLLPSLAFCAALALARSRARTWVAAILGALLGSLLAVVGVGRLVPPFSLLWSELRYSARWFEQWQRGFANRPLPLAEASGHIWQRLGELGTRLWRWGQAAFTGAVAHDETVFWLLAAALAWGLAFLATWQVFRRRAALWGLLPGGVALAILAFFRGGLGIFYLATYLFCTLFLTAACHLWTNRERWDREGTDYPGDLGLELMTALSPMLTLLLAAGMLLPVVHPRQIREAFWELMASPWSAVEQASERLFGPIVRPDGTWGDSRGTLPRSHLLGRGAEPLDRLLFYVTTNDALPPPPGEPEAGPSGSGLPRRYWRTVTYDTYTGQGWVNGPLQARIVPPGQPFDAGGQAVPASGPGKQPTFELHQQFDLVAAEGTLLIAVNAPSQTDHTTEGWWRAPGDLAQVASNARRYTVVSYPPEPTVEDLRTAPHSLPAAIAERYLALPDTVPERVLELAEEVVGEEENRYDQARAIETFLRSVPYTLDLPPLPGGQDLVDYFLFDLQKGYCDYYASAMVVMARAVDIPARLATGYAQGNLDYETGRWVVTTKDGHSWVEVYFDGIGWVEFEPTAGLAALNRLGGAYLQPPVPPLPPRPVTGFGLLWVLLAFGVTLCLLAAAVILLWRPRVRSARSAAKLVQDRYGQLERWGRRLGWPQKDGQTPFEYGITLAAVAQNRGTASRWPQARRAAAQAPIAIQRLTELFVHTQYAPAPISDREAPQIRDLWAHLLRQMWWLWLLGH